MNTTWYSHSHLAGLTFVIVHREAPFVCLAAHELGVSAVDDCRKCRTATATPAEPGDLLWMLEQNCFIRLFPRPSGDILSSSRDPVSSHPRPLQITSGTQP